MRIAPIRAIKDPNNAPKLVPNASALLTSANPLLEGKFLQLDGTAISIAGQ